MAKLSQKEGIAIAVSLVVVGAFLPMIFVSTANVDTNITQSIEDLTKSTSSANTAIGMEAFEGFSIIDLTQGDAGIEAKFGDTISVQYVAMLEDGTEIDSSLESGAPYTFVLGTGTVIPGWDLGLIGMRKGGVRHIVVPASLGYGNTDLTAPDGTVIIPKNANLQFDVYLVDIQEESSH